MEESNTELGWVTKLLFLEMEEKINWYWKSVKTIKGI